MKRIKVEAKPYKAPINMQSKAAKFFVAHRLEKKPRKQALLQAGVTDLTNADKYIKSQTFQKLDKKYGTFLEETIGMKEVAEEHKKNILQDKDLGAKNNAIKLFLERVEPEAQRQDEEDQMIVILRG